MNLAAALLLLPLSLASPATEPEPSDRPADPVDPLTTMQVPPGSKEDQALWELGRARNSLLRQVQDRSTRLQSRLVVRGTSQKLEALARQEGAAGQQAREIRERVAKAKAANIATLTGVWPVDPVRVCGYPLMDFEGQLYSQASGKNTGLYKPLRAKLLDCLERGRIILDAMNEVNGAFEAAIVEAERLVGTDAKGVIVPATQQRKNAEHERHEDHEKAEKHERNEKHEKGEEGRK